MGENPLNRNGETRWSELKTLREWRYSLVYTEKYSSSLENGTVLAIQYEYNGIRSSILGGEFNFSGRAVIVLDPELKIDEVDFPYKAFIEQYKGNIIRRIIKDKGWTITRATNFLASKFNYDDYIYDVICRVVEEDQPKLIINRNPTLTLGSILMMKIRKVKKDSNDYTLAIPSAILPGLKDLCSSIEPWVNKYLSNCGKHVICLY